MFGDKKDLTFKVMTADALDKEYENEQDEFFSTENGLVYYNHYWGVQISKLIIFSETVFKFLISISNISGDSKIELEHFFSQGINKFVDSDGKECKDVQDVLMDMLRIIIET
ncbi:hypothetical protein NNC19_22915 [Clostridium sp. SHJSY1]|uniref:hypothetical protein n=1 Tax=Clostridium sp. SHJSY1 TaxID=2942483 RepID=UPI002874AACE|nr:hypothetical protein [Clostridium sp. SHJSY1]MDS0528532.1 hypothetical protein [Clostridium sp. SHJSY1]